ncbi:MAG TPA: AraC family transcriptional regulator [Microlunatus sp.]|nr:AraC family transcriptional regulator [Microlunatus sp.]
MTVHLIDRPAGSSPPAHPAADAQPVPSSTSPHGEVELRTTDPQTAYDALTAIFGDGVRVSGLRPGDPVRLRRADLGQVALITLTSPAELEWSCEPADRLLISQPVHGVQHRVLAGVEHRIGPGEVAVAPPDRPFHGHNHDLSTRSVSIDLELVAATAANDPERPPAIAALFTDATPLSGAAAERWRQIVDCVRQQAAASAPADGPDLLRQGAASFLSAAAVELFARGPVGRPQLADRTDATPVTLERALRFIEANAARDITVQDVAVAAHVTVRAVQLAFQRHLDTTPMRYLRTVRLDRVREDLRAADPSQGDTVSGVAARWGFYSPGRFSAAYRRRFGETPRATLHG